MKNRKFDPETIRAFIEQDLSDAEIADKFGWTVGTLRVRCSQQKISLRRPGRRRNRRAGCQFTMKFTLPEWLFQRLVERALSMQMPTSELVADLLATIDRDDLYGAVLDRGEMIPETGLAKTTNRAGFIPDLRAA